MKRHRLVLLALILIGVIAVAVVGVLAYLPRIVHQTVIWRLQAATGRTVSIQALDLSLTTGHFSIRGFRMADRESGPPLAEFERLEGRFRRRSLLRGHIWIEALALTGGHVRVVRLGPNRFNISDLIPQGPQTRRAFDVTVEHFTITGGWVELEDRVLKPARTWRSDGIRLDARNLTTLGRQGTAVGFTNVAGALLNLRIEDLRLAPVHLRASLNVRDLDLPLAALYLPADAAVRIERGVLDAAFTIVHDHKDGTTLDADAVVQRLALRRPGMDGDALTAPALHVLVRELHQRPGSIVLRYASLGGDLTVLDPTTTPPRRLQFSDFTATASGLEHPMKEQAQIAVHANVPGGGEVDIGGTAGLAPQRADLRVRARGVELATLARYLPFAGRLDGIARADLRVRVTRDRALALTVSGDTTLERVAVGDGARPAVTAVRIAAIGLEYTSPAALRIADLLVTQPVVRVERDAAGSTNLASLLSPREAESDPGAAAAAPRPTADVLITRLRIEEGRTTATDAGSGGRVEIARIALTAGDVAWPTRGASPVELTATVAGGELAARGTVDPGQRRADVTLRMRGADLATLQPWLPIVGHIRGAADADITVAVALEPLALTVRGGLGASNLKFLDRDRPLLTVGRVDAAGVDLQWPTRLAIDRLRVNEPWAEVARNPHGELSLKALFVRRPDRPAPAAGEAAAPGPIPGLQVSVREAHFENGSGNIIDDAVEPAARFELRGSSLDLRNLTWPAAGAAAVRLSTPMPGGGTLKASGTLSVEPTRLALEAELDQIDLAPARPYLPFDARLSGKLSGRAKVSGTFGEPVALVIDGDATVDRLALGDADRRLATAQRAELAGVRYQYPTSVRINQVSLRKPWLLLERNADGRLEIASLFTPRRPPPPPASGVTGGAPPTPVSRVRVLVRKLTLNDGFVRFVDRTTDPDYAEELSGILLTAEGLGTREDRHATVDLRGQFASGTPLTVQGTLGGLTGPRFLDLTVGVKDFPVPRLNPYLDRLSTWVARQGTLTASLRYKVNGDELEAGNDVTLDGLELEAGGRGAEVQRRVGLPLDLLVSLLKNRQGTIKLNIPVAGRLSAPEFKYADAVWTAVRNLAIRLVALPFNWIGGMYYTADSRIESIQVYPVVFETAKATATAPGADQIQRLATFLKESPAIRLRLRPVTTVADVTALRRQALDSRLASLGTDETARRRAAVGLYTELFPRRQPPASDEALFEELTRETPPPPRALRTLATERVAAIRDALVRAGIPAERLELLESRAAVESGGTGRVEFEIAR